MGYVVVELESKRFRPEHLGQLNFYVAVIYGMLRLAYHAPRRQQGGAAGSVYPSP